MANNFSNTGGCKAVWRFESGQLTTDSQNSNTLTNHGATADAVNFKEGAAAALFAGGAYPNGQYLYINDANLISGFPLRSDDIVKKFSFTCWIRPTDNGHIDVFSNMEYANQHGIRVETYNGNLIVYWGTGSADENWTVASITLNQWYHLGITGDGIAKTMHVRVWDVTAGVVGNHDHTFTNSLALAANPFYVGMGDSLSNPFIGNIDELVAFNFQLGDADIDAIRNGTYTAPHTAVIGSGGIIVGGAGIIGFSSPLLVAIIGSGGIQIGGQGVIAVVYPPIKAVIGSGGIVVGGQGIIVCKGPDYLAQVVGSGGIQIGGEGVIAFTMPPVLHVVGSGGIVVGGRGIISSPPILAVVGSGGIQIGGKGVIASIFPTPPPVLAVIGSGGIQIGGAGVINFTMPPVLNIIGSGGIQIGGFRVPELTVVKFFSPADLITAVVGSGGIEIGGAGIVGFTTPPVYNVPVPQAADNANIYIGGKGVIAFIYPQILEVIGEGGVLLGGTPIGAEVYDTYVLTGTRGEPSIYSNFPFNSYALHHGQYFGAGEDGIYLQEGEDDDGAEIHSGVRIGPFNLGSAREKRLRLLRLGGETTGAQVKVTDDQGRAGYYDVKNDLAQCSRDVQGRELTIDIADFDSLDHLEIVHLELAKR